MQSKWTNIAIGELIAHGTARLQTGPFGSQLHKHDYIASGTFIIPTEAIGRGSILTDVQLPQISAEKTQELQRHRLQLGDILFARRGAQATGLSALIGPKHANALCGTGALLLRVNREVVDPRFLAAYLATDEARDWLKAHAVGAVMPNLNAGIIAQLRVPLPSISTQRKIGALSCELGDRVELLRQSNTTLESIAQVLFRSWFIDFDPVHAKAEGCESDGMEACTAALFPDEFEQSALGLIPKGWQVGTLGDVCVNPRVQAKPGQIPADMTYIGLEHMPRKSIALSDAGRAEGLASGKFWFEQNDVLFGKLRPYFHKVGLAPNKGVCSTDILVVRPKTASYLGFVLMHTFSDELIAHTTRLSNGARMPRTSWQDIQNYKVVLPPSDVMAAFDQLVRPLFERIFVNIAHGTQLGELRDTLLPRLTSGKLHLPEAQEQVDEAPK